MNNPVEIPFKAAYEDASIEPSRVMASGDRPLTSEEFQKWIEDNLSVCMCVGTTEDGKKVCRLSVIVRDITGSEFQSLLASISYRLNGEK
jgi:hypothetical protein